MIINDDFVELTPEEVTQAGLILAALQEALDAECDAAFETKTFIARSTNMMDTLQSCSGDPFGPPVLHYQPTVLLKHVPNL